MVLIGTPAGKLQRIRKWGRDAFAALLRAIFTVIAFVGWLAGDRRRDLASLRIEKILLIRVDLLGDLVLTMPAVAAVRRRYPKAHITMLVLPYTAPALELFPYVDEVLSFDINKLRPSGDMLNPAHYQELWRLLRKLRQEKFDLCVSFHGLYAGLFSFLSGSLARAGYRGEGCPFLYNVPLPGKRYSIPQHEVHYDMALARAAGAEDTQAAPDAAIPQYASENVATLLAKEGISPHDLLIAFHPGSANGSAKRWPAPGWAALADRLFNDLGARIVLTGVNSELPLAKDIVGMTKNRPAVLTGKTSIVEAAALLARCRVLVSGDSAPLHMASAIGTPVVALHGPTDPDISGPFGGRSVVIWKKTECSPCYDLSDTAECRNKTLLCMRAITPEEVYTAVESLLQTPARMTPGATA